MVSNRVVPTFVVLPWVGNVYIFINLFFIVVVPIRFSQLDLVLC